MLKYFLFKISKVLFNRNTISGEFRQKLPLDIKGFNFHSVKCNKETALMM